MLCSRKRTIKTDMHMMKKIKILFGISLICGCITAAYGEVNEDSMNKLRAWGGAEIRYCFGSSMGNASIGVYKDTCKGGYNINDVSPSQCFFAMSRHGMHNKDNKMRGGYVIMMVARDIRENGARFCATTVWGEYPRKNGGMLPTEIRYSDTGQGAYCIWLCKPGYRRDGCTQQVTRDSCDTTTIHRSDFDGYTYSNNSNLDTEIQKFHWNAYDNCGTKEGKEHDMILAISDWLPSGHGVKARPFILYARREAHNKAYGAIEVLPAGSETILCKTGYEPNADESDCIERNTAACALEHVCSGWSDDEFDAATMTLHYNEDQNCYEYRCLDGNEAFVTDLQRTCSTCVLNARWGVSPVYGTCVECERGQIFDENAVATGYCKPVAATYTKQELQYGIGKNKDSRLEDQCWVKPERQAYAACVTGETSQTTTDDGSRPSFVQSTITLTGTVTNTNSVNNNTNSGGGTSTSSTVIPGGGMNVMGYTPVQLEGGVTSPSGGPVRLN